MSEALSSVGRERLSGRAQGAFILGGFAALWLFLGFGELRKPLLLGAAVAAAELVCVIVLGVAVLRAAKRVPSRPMPAMENARVWRVFTAVNIIQGVAIFTASIIFGLLKKNEFVPTAIGVIVGLHFLPLAGSFRQPIYLWTGWGMVLWCAVCALLVPLGMLAGVTSIGCGGILVATAMTSLGWILWAVRAGGEGSSLQG